MYNQVYAPAYPDEDRTSLEREEREIQSGLAQAISAARREDVGDWLRLIEQSVIQAFQRLRANDKNAASKAFESAIEYLRNASSRKSFKVDFVARADGTIESEPEE